MKVIYNDNTVNLPEGTTVEEARQALKGIYPEVANATAEEVDGGIRFVVQSGTKGADLRVIYGENEINLPEGTTDEEARQALATIHPEVANATSNRDGDTLRFVVQSGTKGN